MWTVLKAVLGWIINPKVLLSLALVAAFGLYTNYIYDKGARHQKLESEQLVLEKAEQLAELQQELEKSREKFKAAIAVQNAEQAALVKSLTDRLAIAEKRGDAGRQTVKEVIRYVTQKSDTACTIPVGFVYVHESTLAGNRDSSAAPSVPVDAEAPSGVALSAVAETVGWNNAEAVERGEVIKAWQEWYEKMKEWHAGLQEQVGDR